MKSKNFLTPEESLEDMIVRIKWVEIESHRQRWGIPEDAIWVAFEAGNPKTPELINTVRIKIGRTIREKLNWNYKDQISIMYNPDDVMSFLLVKKETGKAYTLSKDFSASSSTVKCRWDRPAPLFQRKMSPVKFSIHKNQYIHFRVDRDE